MSILNNKRIPPCPYIEDKKDKLIIGSYYPFVMKNGKGHHKCVGYVFSNGIYVTNMGFTYEKEDILWVGDEIKIDFPEEYCRPKYL